MMSHLERERVIGAGPAATVKIKGLNVFESVQVVLGNISQETADH